MSISDVAKHAGVGVSTVSRVLNQSPRVSPAARSRVLDAIAKLDYHPSRLATGLSRGRPETVAVVVPYITRPSVVARLEGVLDVLDSNGLNTALHSVSSTSQRDRHLAVLADLHETLGVIVISIPLVPEQVDRFSSNGIFLSLIDTAFPGIPHVVIDDRGGGRMAGDHLVALGHERIGFIGDNESSGLGFSSTQLRLQGLRDALEAAGLALDGRLVRLGPHNAIAARELTENLLNAKRPPTAIFAASDTQATGVLAGADAVGARVPRDAAVIGFDGLEVAAILGLSTIRQSLRQSGVEGAMRLLDLLEGREIVEHRTLLGLELLARSTTLGGSLAPRSGFPP
ncbi:MAG: LacI family DNA-binding transcriptional regulator [Ferrimicrobium sp.]